MKISDLINDYGKDHSPYMGNLVNHLPMAQFALFKMTDDIEKVKSYTESYLKRAKIKPVKEKYPKIETMEECLGNRQLYESCLDIVKQKIKEKDVKEILTYVLNEYPLGMSSGLFHTIIRVAYAVEGIGVEEELEDEVARALAYYITAYREAGLLTRKVNGNNIIDETNNIINDPHIKELLKFKETLGQKMKSLYEDEVFMETGFIIDGNEDEKIEALLNFLLPAYNNTESIVILHCITGLHAIMVLKEYYNDYPKILDILTTCILTHLLTVEDVDFNDNEKDSIDLSWNEIFERGTKSTDVHAIKLTYTSSELYKRYEKPLLKKAALNRIN